MHAFCSIVGSGSSCACWSEAYKIWVRHTLLWRGAGLDISNRLSRLA